MAPAKQKPAELYGITRNASNKGWKVDLTREGVTLSKAFCFSLYGGEERALLRAQRWRDEMVRKHPPVTRRQRANTLRRNNKSGIPGVTFATGPDGEPVRWYAKTYLGPGNILRKAFSVRLWGAQAKRLAIAERKKQLRQMEGLARVHPGEAAVRSAPSRPLPSDCPAPITKAEIVRSTNKSGIPGVQFRQAHEGAPGRWVALTDMGTIGSRKCLWKSFSVKVHGEEKAKELAIAARQAQLRQKAQAQLQAQGATKRQGKARNRSDRATNQAIAAHSAHATF